MNKLDKLKKEIKDLYKLHQDLNKRETEILKTVRSIENKNIFKYDWLRKGIWIFEYGTQIYLCSKEKDFPNLHNLYSEWKDDIEIESGTWIRFESHLYICLMFDNNDIALNFIRKHKLKINTEKFEIKLNEYYNMLNKLKRR